MDVKLSQAVSMLGKYIKIGLVPMLHGSPGIGKSSIVQELARQYNLKLIDLRLSQCDPTDMLGFPTIINGRTAYVPPAHFPLEGDEIPAGFDGWLLFLDEANASAKAVQSAAYKLILDRMVGQLHLHKRCVIVAAGNLESDNAIVEPMSTALQSRLAHIKLMNDVEEWIHWAEQADFDHRITSYIKFKPEALYSFRPDHEDLTYSCNRTWEFANRVVKATSDNDPDRLPMLAGVISEGPAREFVTFTKIYLNLPTIADILMAPESIPMPNEPSILYALTGSIAPVMQDSNIEKFMPFINRMPIEFQTVCLREVMRRNKALVKHPAILAWTLKVGIELF